MYQCFYLFSCFWIFCRWKMKALKAIQTLAKNDLDLYHRLFKTWLNFFFKISVHFCKKFSCVYCEIFKSTFFTKHLGKKCPFSEFFWSLFSRILTKYGEIRSIQSKSGKIYTRKAPNTENFCVVRTSAHSCFYTSDHCSLYIKTSQLIYLRSVLSRTFSIFCF